MSVVLSEREAIARCINQVRAHAGNRGGLQAEQACFARLPGDLDIRARCAAAARRLGEWLRSVSLGGAGLC